MEEGLVRRVYDLQLERAYLRAMRAVARRDEADGEVIASLEGTLAQLEAALEDEDSQAAGAGLELPMQRLAAWFGLPAVEQELVWAAVTAAGDPRFIVPATALMGSEARRGLSLALFSLLAGLDGNASRGLALRMSAEHPLIRYQLLEAVAGDSPHVVRAGARLGTYLAGEDVLDPVIAARGGPVRMPARPLFDEAQEAARHRLAEALMLDGGGEQGGEREDGPLLVILEGPAGSGRSVAVASVAPCEVIAVDLERIAPTQAATDETLIALRRECMLRGSLPVICNADALLESEGAERLRSVGRLLDDFPGPVVLTSARIGMALGVERRVLRIGWPLPGTATRLALWHQALGEAWEARLDPELGPIALRYVLGAGGIERAAATARHLARVRGEERRVAPVDVTEGIRNHVTERLGTLARRVETRQGWGDLVLAPDLLDQVQSLIARVRHAHRVYEEWGFGQKMARGLGLPILLSGPPGTGKTMVAGVIARELGLELLQVDLSQVVSKWIGETEKQLSTVFDAAEAGHALLLFDEADALFAKRTEVRGSNDRHANLEVNYLLQRVESFSGITILTTNFETSIDPALKRRLASHIVFWPPDEEEREALWRRMLATGSAPLAEAIEPTKLARMFPDMTGANIRNAVLAAAFLAAAEDGAITQEHLERAAKGEYRTMGRVLR